MTDQFRVLTEVTVTSGYRCDFRQLCGEGRTGACEAEKSAHGLRSGWRYVPVSIFCSLVTRGHGDVSTVLKLDLPELFQNKLFLKKVSTDSSRPRKIQATPCTEFLSGRHSK